MPHTDSIEDYIKLSKHTGPKSEYVVRQFLARSNIIEAIIELIEISLVFINALSVHNVHITAE